VRFVPWLWIRFRWILAVAVILWGVGVLLDLPAIWATAFAIEVSFTSLHRHVLRSDPLTLILCALFVGQLALTVGLQALR